MGNRLPDEPPAIAAPGRWLAAIVLLTTAARLVPPTLEEGLDAVFVVRAAPGSAPGAERFEVEPAHEPS